jgi:hypothetical protein
MNRYAKIAVIGAVMMALVLASVAVVVAQDPEDSTTSGPFRWVERLREAIANALGISVEEYESAIDTAKEKVLKGAVDEGWLTEEQAERFEQHLEGGPDWMSFRFPRVWPRTVRTKHSLESVAAEQLGMTTDELFDALEEAKTLAELAEEKGVKPEAIVEAYMAGIREELDQAVADEDIAQKQADAILERLEEQAQAYMDKSSPWRLGPLGDEREFMPHMERRAMPGRGMRGFGWGPF